MDSLTGYPGKYPQSRPRSKFSRILSLIMSLYFLLVVISLVLFHCLLPFLSARLLSIRRLSCRNNYLRILMDMQYRVSRSLHSDNKDDYRVSSDVRCILEHIGAYVVGLSLCYISIASLILCSYAAGVCFALIS